MQICHNVQVLYIVIDLLYIDLLKNYLRTKIEINCL